MRERYENSEAAVAHLRKFAAIFGERYGRMVERKRFLVFGEPSDELRTLLNGYGVLSQAVRFIALSGLIARAFGLIGPLREFGDCSGNPVGDNPDSAEAGKLGMQEQPYLAPERGRRYVRTHQTGQCVAHGHRQQRFP
jgi:hypothetical protein